MKQDGTRLRLASVVWWMNQHSLLLILGGGLIAILGPTLPAQSDSSSAQGVGSFEIRLEAREVIVPVFVENEYLAEITGLAPKDFQVFEDGDEQSVRNVGVEAVRSMSVPDNIGMHVEYSETPKGIWAIPDAWLPSGAKWSTAAASPAGAVHEHYLVSYAPPTSSEGSCHQIKVTVDRPEARVYARDEYCNTEHSPFDPLKGTSVGRQMEEDAASTQGGELPLAVQAAATFKGADAGRVSVAVEFPWRAAGRSVNGCQLLAAPVDLMGLVYKKDGTLAARFSDSDYLPNGWYIITVINLKTGMASLWSGDSCISGGSQLPNRYETQLDLSSGNYTLRVVATDGKKFGRADVPLTVVGYDGNNLAVSGIVLGKRVTRMAVTWPEGAQRRDRNGLDQSEINAEDRPNHPKNVVSTAPEYVPLVSNGIGVTPTGDTSFRKDGRLHKGDRLMTYFEVYEPLLAAGDAKVEFQIRVTDAKTGQVQLNSGLRSAESYARPGNPIIPIGWEIPIDKLAKGAFRVEVQASDSAGKQTGWRAASFTVE